MTKNQQPHGGIVNCYWLPSRAKINGTGYYRCNLLVTHVTAMQNSNMAIISPNIHARPPAGWVPRQQEPLAGCRTPQSIYSSTLSLLTCPWACRAQMLLLASSSKQLPLRGLLMANTFVAHSPGCLWPAFWANCWKPFASWADKLALCTPLPGRQRFP